MNDEIYSNETDILSY